MSFKTLPNLLGYIQTAFRRMYDTNNIQITVSIYIIAKLWEYVNSSILKKMSYKVY